MLGPNVLLTVVGHKSGLARTTPVAMLNSGGRGWIIGTFGPVGWVKNLRAAHAATVTAKGRSQQVSAHELSSSEAAAFFGEILTPFVKRVPLGRLLLRFLGASDMLNDPANAALRYPVFELVPAVSGGDRARSGAAPTE
jgi:deazaflavin-dependent oxidoreductase (nitroreductase family)